MNPTTSVASTCPVPLFPTLVGGFHTLDLVVCSKVIKLCDAYHAHARVGDLYAFTYGSGMRQAKWKGLRILTED